MERNRKAVSDAIKFLRRHHGSPKILVKQIRNLGDTLHLTPVIHHYRLKYPGAAIAFVVGQWYHNIHEHNPHINGLFLADHNATPQQRLRLWPLITKAKGVDIKVVASIFPFGEKYPQNRWCHANIADQYLSNASVPMQPLGGRKLIAKITPDDAGFANQIKERHHASKLVVLEYVSYSKSPVWQASKFKQLVHLLEHHGIKCVTVAASHEGLIPGTIDCRGITWRQTVAILSRSIAMVGVGSGITMLAAAAEPQPRIIELGIANSVSMKGCGYAPSISVPDPAVSTVKRLILEVAG
jgi:ADP-heptose:LPS heptosyltransferase